jgi:hypothetical protein
MEACTTAGRGYIETGLPGRDYVVIKQRQSDGTDKIFVLTALETHELIGSPAE